MANVKQFLFEALGTGKNTAQLTMALLLSAVYFSFFYDDNLFYIVFFAIYFYYSWIKKSLETDIFNRLFLYLFVGFSLVITASNFGRIWDLSILEFSGRDWRMLFHPLVVLMIMDSIYSLARYHAIKISHLAGPVILSIILGTGFYAILSSDFSFWEILNQDSERHSGLVRRNVNLADDVYFFLSCSLVAMFLFFRGDRNLFIILGVISIFVIAAFMFLIIDGQSRAGWLGIAVGIVSVLIYGGFNKRILIPLIMVAIVTPVLLFNASKISARLFKEQAIYEAIWDQIKTDGTIDVNKLDRESGRSTYARIKGYENAWELFKLRPWTGHGGFKTEKLIDLVPHKENFERIVHSHNIIFDATLRLGLGVGLVYLTLLLFPIVFLFWLAARVSESSKYYNFAIIFLAYSIYVIVENMVDLSFIRSDPGVRIQYLFYTIMGLFLAQACRSAYVGLHFDLNQAKLTSNTL